MKNIIVKNILMDVLMILGIFVIVGCMVTTAGVIFGLFGKKVFMFVTVAIIWLLADFIE